MNDNTIDQKTLTAIAINRETDGDTLLPPGKYIDVSICHAHGVIVLFRNGKTEALPITESVNELMNTLIEFMLDLELADDKDENSLLMNGIVYFGHMEREEDDTDPVKLHCGVMHIVQPVPVLDFVQAVGHKACLMTFGFSHGSIDDIKHNRSPALLMDRLPSKPPEKSLGNALRVFDMKHPESGEISPCFAFCHQSQEDSDASVKKIMMHQLSGLDTSRPN